MSSTASASRQIFTPQSENDSSSSERMYTPSTTDSLRSSSVTAGEPVDVNEPLPSIETGPEFGPTLTSDGTSALRARSPSFSITPPATQENTIFTPSSTTPSRPTPTTGSQISGLGERVAALGLSRDGTPNQSFSGRGTYANPPQQAQSSSYDCCSGSQWWPCRGNLLRSWSHR